MWLVLASPVYALALNLLLASVAGLLVLLLRYVAGSLPVRGDFAPTSAALPAVPSTAVDIGIPGTAGADELEVSTVVEIALQELEVSTESTESTSRRRPKELEVSTVEETPKGLLDSGSTPLTGHSQTFARQFTGRSPDFPSRPGHCFRRATSSCQGVYGMGGYSQSNRVLLCMVGLPARGKSYIAQMLERYLRWAGFPCKIFNAGSLRRQKGMAGASASFFSGQDSEARALREEYALECLEEAISWLNEQTGVSVAIFDATNTTKRRRKAIMVRCYETKGVVPVFVESICDDPKILEENYRLKAGNEDYRGQDPAEARQDFLERVGAYTQYYETVTDDELQGQVCYIKLFNVGEKVIMYHCAGYLTSQIGSYLSNVHISPRSIWLTLPGESDDWKEDVVGSQNTSGKLTESGTRYCQALAAFLSSRRSRMKEAGETGAELLVLMGTAPVHGATLDAMSSWRSGKGLLGSLFCLDATGTGACLDAPSSTEDASGPKMEFSAMSSSLLNELDGGDFTGKTLQELEVDFPEVWVERMQDPLHFRYPGPGGESYSDVIGRLRPIILELERQRRSVLVISHLAVQRCLYAYFTGCPMEDLTQIELEKHCVVELRPGPYGCTTTTLGLLGEKQQ
ncbi:unnamed protein product [Polarella glacialis]|uniref:6-phosphofructo-2-kinase domain-containing protein n=1 Tax=Polarella glacialis TaxID=89957 RepID=A0A813JQU6_POLGL|nr:unnamed protein product [Polarella glacialis]CAE8682048.1 unnamed protein product [Polarella glacialis]